MPENPVEAAVEKIINIYNQSASCWSSEMRKKLEKETTPILQALIAADRERYLDEMDNLVAKLGVLVGDIAGGAINANEKLYGRLNDIHTELVVVTGAAIEKEGSK